MGRRAFPLPVGLAVVPAIRRQKRTSQYSAQHRPFEPDHRRTIASVRSSDVQRDRRQRRRACGTRSYSAFARGATEGCFAETGIEKNARCLHHDVIYEPVFCAQAQSLPSALRVAAVDTSPNERAPSKTDLAPLFFKIEGNSVRT